MEVLSRELPRAARNKSLSLKKDQPQAFCESSTDQTKMQSVKWDSILMTLTGSSQEAEAGKLLG